MNEKYKKLAVTLARLTERGKCALWLSGGKDSLLLLEMLIGLKLKFCVLNFNAAWTKEQNEVIDTPIKKHKLLVYSYPPKAITLIGDGENVALAAMYAVGKNGEAATVLSDFVHGSRCAFDVNIKLSQRVAPIIRFDIHIWGTKKNETHFAHDGKPMLNADSQKVGDVEIHFPLFDWTDAEVLEALKFLNIEYEKPDERSDTGNAVACSNCLRESVSGVVYCPKVKKEIPTVAWNSKENLKNWRKLCSIT